MSTVGSRSAFYVVPLYGLRSLWLAAGVQALLVSWILWVAACTASIRNAVKQLTSFMLSNETNTALVNVLHEGVRRASVTASITPNVEACSISGGEQCNRLLSKRTWPLIYRWHYAVIAASGLLLAFRLTPALMSLHR